MGLASSSSVYDSYWDLNTSGKDDSAFDEGRTTKQLQAGISDALLDEKGIPDPDGDEVFVCRALRTGILGGQIFLRFETNSLKVLI